MTIKLIGLAGPARSGKDTAGHYLKQRLGIETYALASPIKVTINEFFGWDERHSDGELKEVVDPVWGCSPRKAYQLFGTEFGRSIRPDLWLHMAKVRFNELGGLIVTDIRFENEAQWIRQAGGTIIHVQRDDCESILSHASEAGIEVHPDDWVAPNNGSHNDLYDILEEILSLLRENGENEETEDESHKG